METDPELQSQLPTIFANIIAELNEILAIAMKLKTMDSGGLTVSERKADFVRLIDIMVQSSNVGIQIIKNYSEVTSDTLLQQYFRFDMRTPINNVVTAARFLAELDWDNIEAANGLKELVKHSESLQIITTGILGISG